MELAQPKMLCRFPASSPISSVTCGSGGLLAAADGTKAGSVKLWHLEKGLLLPLSHETPVDLLALSGNDGLLATASASKVHVCDPNSWHEVTAFGLQNSLKALAFHPQSTFLATADKIAQPASGIQPMVAKLCECRTRKMSLTSALITMADGQAMDRNATIGSCSKWNSFPTCPIAL